MVEMEPINLVTGLPGAGKTLFAIDLLRKCEREGLQCFNFNVKGLDPAIARPWPAESELFEGLEGDALRDAQVSAIARWAELPRGSVLVVDEAHSVFPVRPANAREPAHIAALAEIRHKGIRLIIVDQDPSTLDRFVKRRVGAHFHLVNRTGFNSARVYSNRGCVDNPRASGAWSVGESNLWNYPKELFARYRSASVHIKRRKIPRKLFVLLGGIVLAVAGVWYAVSSYSFGAAKAARADGEAAVSIADAQNGQGIAHALFGAPMQQNQLRYPDATAWAAAHAPMIKGIPWSAPVFHDLPITTVPDLHCILVGSRCRCYSEQITRVDVDHQFCLAAVRNGVYNPYRAKPAGAPIAGVQRESPVLDDASLRAVAPATSARNDAAAAIAERRAVVRAFAAPPPVQAFEGIR